MCVCVCMLYKLLRLNRYRTSRWGELSTAGNLRSVVSSLRGWFKPFNELFKAKIIFNYPNSNLTSISVQPIHFTNWHSSNTHTATLGGLCLHSYFSHRAVAKSQRLECALMNKTRLLDSYMWREMEQQGGKEAFPGVTKWNPPPFSSFSLFPSHQLGPYRVFSRDKADEGLVQKCCLYAVCFSVFSHVMCWSDRKVISGVGVCV